MGNNPSNIKIQLENRNLNETTKDYSITASTGSCEGCVDFETVTYKINFITDKHFYNLILEHNNSEKPFFTYYSPNSREHLVEEVYSIFSKSHNERPVVIGFQTENKERYYYRYYDLKYVKISTTIEVRGIECIGKEGLVEQLKDEKDIIDRELTLKGPFKDGYGSIYLSDKGEDESEYTVEIKSSVKCSIRVTKSKYNQSKTVLKVTYRIVYFGDIEYNIWDNTWYSWSNWKYYLYFYKGTRENEGTNIYTYYPRNSRHTIISVDAYISLLYINEPFFLSFLTRAHQNLPSSFDELSSGGSGYTYNYVSFHGHEIHNKVKGAYNKKFSQLTFSSGKNDNQHIKTVISDVSVQNPKATGNKSYKKVLLISSRSKDKESIVYSGCLFTLNNTENSCRSNSRSQKSNEFGTITNKPIGDNLLTDVIKTKHDGIIVYYTTKGNVALVVDFITDCNNKRTYVRKDFEGDDWKEEVVDYDSDKTLFAQLEKVESDIETRITYRLENNTNYNYDKIKVSTQSGQSDGYTIYKHLPTNSANLRETHVLYRNKRIEIVGNSNITNQDHKLSTLVGIVFKEINVYSIDTNRDEHLIIHLKEKNDKSHYLHRFNKDGTKWRQIGLSDVIELKLISSHLLGGMRDILRTEDPGQRLYKVFSTSNNSKKMLQHISECINSIMVLIDNKNLYGKSRIQDITRDDKEIAPIDIGTNNVDVEEDTTSGSCIKIKNYKIFKHDLTSAASKAFEKTGNSKLSIRLYSGSKRITIYTDEKEEVQQTLAYNQDSNYLYVYFKENGNKPLMFHYNKQTYGPKDKNDNIWLRKKDISDCKSETTIKSELERSERNVNGPKVQQRSQDGGGRDNSETYQHDVSGQQSPQDMTSKNASSTRSLPTSDHSPSSVGTPSSSRPKVSQGLEPSRTETGGQGTYTYPTDTDQSQKSLQPGSENNTPDKSSSNAITYGSAGGGGTAGLVGTGVGGYFLYAKLIRPRLL